MKQLTLLFYTDLTGPERVSGVQYLVLLQLPAVLGQRGVQGLVLLRGLNHSTPAEDGGGDVTWRSDRRAENQHGV